MEQYLQSIDIRELPDHYPPDEDTKQRFRNGLQQAMTSVSSPPGVSPDDLLAALLNEAVGLGPIEYFLDDSSITEVVISGVDRVIVRRGDELVVGERGFCNADTLYMVAARLLSVQGYGSNPPPISEVRFGDGTLAQVILPPVSVGGATITLRKPQREFRPLNAMVEGGALSNGMAEFLHQAVQARRTILVAGPQGSGRTSFANALMGLVPDGARIVTVEQTSMLQLPQRSAIALETQAPSAYSAGVDMASLVEHAVRLRPERLVVDEIRGAEASSFLLACAGGAAGSIGVVSGLNAGDALQRVQQGVLQSAAPSAQSAQGAVEQVASAIDVVVVLNQFADGTRRVVEIAEVAVPGYGYVELDTIFAFELQGMGDGASGSGQFKATGTVPRFYQELENGGVGLDHGIFRE